MAVTCPNDGTEPTLRHEAKQAETGTTGASAAMIPVGVVGPGLECPQCGELFAHHGKILKPLGG